MVATGGNRSQIGSPSKRPLLVLVAAMIPSPGELFADWWTNAGYESGYDDVFYHDVPPALAAEAKRRERGEDSKALREPWPLDAWPDVPTRYLLCRDDRGIVAPGLEIRPARPDEGRELKELALRAKGYWEYDDDFVEATRGSSHSPSHPMAPAAVECASVPE